MVFNLGAIKPLGFHLAFSLGAIKTLGFLMVFSLGAVNTLSFPMVSCVQPALGGVPSGHAEAMRKLCGTALLNGACRCFQEASEKPQEALENQVHLANVPCGMLADVRLHSTLTQLTT